MKLGLLGVVGDMEKGIKYEKKGPVAAVQAGVEPVSYTHLTLPTIYSV